MGLLDVFGGKEQSMTLDVATLEKWPQRLLRQQRLDETMQAYLLSLEKKRGRVENALKTLVDPRLREKKVPERSLVIYDDHASILYEHVATLLSKADFFNDVFLVEEQQEDFRQALDAYHAETSKSVAALKEYLQPELQTLHDRVNELEDEILSITPSLEAKGFANIKALKAAIDSYKESRSKATRLEELKHELLAEVDVFEAKKRKIKERIEYYVGRSHNKEFQKLIAQEAEILEAMDEVKVRFLPQEEEAKALQPLKERLALTRKLMITDVTALNISEQRTFLENVKDELRLRKRKLERVDELLTELSFDSFKARFTTLLDPFNVRVEEANEVFESEGEEDVAPQ